MTIHLPYPHRLPGETDITYPQYQEILREHPFDPQFIARLGTRQASALLNNLRIVRTDFLRHHQNPNPSPPATSNPFPKHSSLTPFLLGILIGTTLD